MENIGFEFNKRIFWNLWDANQNEIIPVDKKVTKYSKDNFQLKKKIVELRCSSIKEGVKIIQGGLPDFDPDFSFEIAWPGLYSGLGYTHDTGKSDEEFKTGFSFHHTTGIPIIPDSAVKGLLRSYFPLRYGNSEKSIAVKRKINKILLELFPSKIIDSEKLEREIFGEKEEEEYFMNAKKRIRFCMAIPSNTNPDNMLLFNIDTITPHDHPLHEPVPLRTLSINPGVKINFYFQFTDTKQLSKKEIKMLFQYLLLNFGAGAKTNSGYGQFIKAEERGHENINEGYLDFLILPKIADFKPNEKSTNQYDRGNNEHQGSGKPEYDPFNSKYKKFDDSNKIIILKIPEQPDWMDKVPELLNKIIEATVVGGSGSGSITVQPHIKGAMNININGNVPLKTKVKIKLTEKSGKLEKGNLEFTKATLIKP